MTPAKTPNFAMLNRAKKPFRAPSFLKNRLIENRQKAQLAKPRANPIATAGVKCNVWVLSSRPECSGYILVSRQRSTRMRL